MDDGLSRLLELERRVEARIREAEQEARRVVEEARVAVESATVNGRADLNLAIREQEQADLARHGAELQRIKADGQERVQKLKSVPDHVIERLAQEAFALVIGGGTG